MTVQHTNHKKKPYKAISVQDGRPDLGVTGGRKRWSERVRRLQASSGRRFYLLLRNMPTPVCRNAARIATRSYGNELGLTHTCRQRSSRAIKRHTILSTRTHTLLTLPTDSIKGRHDGDATTRIRPFTNDDGAGAVSDVCVMNPEQREFGRGAQRRLEQLLYRIYLHLRFVRRNATCTCASRAGSYFSVVKR